MAVSYTHLDVYKRQELCSWFDQLRMEALDRIIGSAVPIGTCGEVYLSRKAERD